MAEYIHVSIAWPYANGDLHAGHVAGSMLPADIFARFHRLNGNHVLMVSGSDSHGTPTMIAADERGITPREVFEYFHERDIEALQGLGISYDLYTHTDTENHHEIAQDIFKILLERDYLYSEVQERFYSPTEDRFLEDRYVEGTCPKCGYEHARGDQCDNCDSLLNATDLIDPRGKKDGAIPILKKTEHYFFDLSKFREPLRKFIEERQDIWRETVYRESISKVDDQRGRPITRDMKWGISVPIDDEAWSEKSLYVWFEAVMGYLTASIEWAKNNDRGDDWKKWWYNPDAKGYYFLGKDNILFHSIIWPAELTGISGLYNEGDDTPISLPYDIPANQYLNLEARKFSKSQKWYISMLDLLERYDADAVRYYLTAVMPEKSDTDWKWDDFVARNNNELLAKFGNLVNRVLKFTYKHWEGVVPTPGELTDMDQDVIKQVEAGFDSVSALLNEVKIKAALEEAMRLATAVNIYLDNAPWFGSTIKEDKPRAATTMYVALQCINNLRVIFAPFVPNMTEKLNHILGHDDKLFGTLDVVEVEESTRNHKALVYDALEPRNLWQPSILPAGQNLNEPQALVTKLKPEVVEEERARLGAED